MDMFTSRPKVGETEEDLLNQEEEFLKTKSGKVEGERRLPLQHNPREVQIPPVIGNVVERNTGEFLGPPSISKQSFPGVFKIDNTFKPTKTKKSMFAQQLERKKNLITPQIMDSVVGKRTECETILTGPEKDSIHKENQAKIAQMSEEDILREQKILLETLDTNLVQFLRNRRKVTDKQTTVLVKESSVVPDLPLESGIDAEETIPQNLKYIDKKWLDIGVVEKEKLEWIGDIPNASALDSEKPYSARFDFKGILQPFTKEIDVRESLHHHGSEPDRPGYTLQELYQLSRSNVIQQRILALNTMANIIEKTKLGYYDECFDGVLLQTIMDNDIYLLLRFSLDENIESVILATINCLHKLIYNKIDDRCLDKCLGMVDSLKEPVMKISILEKDLEESELKDDVLIRLDLVKGILRTDFLVRINYILNNFKVFPELVNNILEILITIVRHSVESCQNVATSPILEFIVDEFILKKPYYLAIKLLRIIVCNSKEMVLNFLGKVLNKIVGIISLDEDVEGISKSENYQLHVECWYIWESLLFYGLGVDCFLNYTSNSLRFLNFYFETLNFQDLSNYDFDHFSGLLSCLKRCVLSKISISEHFYVVLSNILQKWMTQLCAHQVYTFTNLKALGNIFDFFVEYYQAFGITKTQVQGLQNLHSQVLNKFLVSNLCDRMFSDFLNHSVILGDTLNVPRDPKNLKTLKTLFLNGENYIKIVQEKSTIPFYLPFLKFLQSSFKICSLPTINLFLSNSKLLNYTSKISQISLQPLNWFFKYEVFFLVCLSDSLVTKIPKPFFLKVLYLIQNNENYLRDNILNIIFSPLFWRDLPVPFLPELDLIRELYVSLLPNVNYSLISLENGTAMFFPLDWLYLPIMDPNSGLKENTLNLVLQFIFWTNSNFNDFLSPTARFCRLCHVFLQDSDLIPNQNWYINFKLILVGQKFDFNEDILGIKSFYDFYMELLQQYSATSYGNTLFANVILVPLQNRFDVSFRKLIWSEYLHALKVVNLQEADSELGLSLRDFIEPYEEDESLLECYLKNIATNKIMETRNKLVHEIALLNLKNYVKFYEPKSSRFYVSFLSKIKSMKNETLKNKILGEV